MESHIGNIMTLSNSIIGVSILAMPFCFKQCGIVLAILMLLISSIITRLTSHFLLKSAIMARRRTFELLAFHAFGTAGKFMVELGIIGFLMGTCIAFFVIIGDLGPAIIAKIMGTKPTDTLRTYILVGVALFCVLPLGLLKNVDSLHSVSTATIGFYFCLVLKTISESASRFVSGDWFANVELWRPAGILQCLPIFSMALSCQTQLFEIYETVSNPTLDKMNYIVRIAINICVAVYIFVGFFGYSAFSNQQFAGNILMSFSQSSVTDVMKIGFVLSVAFSFPLVIFPCRASLYSLLFKKGYTPYEGANNYIPEAKFKFLTFIIIATSLLIGISIPNIEVVLGLLGSTVGTMICMIFPVTCFICISTKNTNERLLAQILLFVGVIVMVMGTYANLYAMEQINDPIKLDKPPIVEIHNDIMKKIESAKIYHMEPEVKNIDLNPIIDETKVRIKEKTEEVRLEPPQPVEPIDEIKKINIIPEKKLPKVVEIHIKQKDHEISDNKILLNTGEMEKIEESITEPAKELKETKETETKTKKTSDFDVEAIKKEETELQEEEKSKPKEDKEEEKQRGELLKKLEEHKKEQENLIKEQKELIQELKKEKQELKEQQKIEDIVEKEARRKAASQILEIAKKAIAQLAPEAISKSPILLPDPVNNKETENVRKKIIVSVNKEENINKTLENKIMDPIAKKIMEFANNNIVNNAQNQNIKNAVPNDVPLIPLPMAVNKNLNINNNNNNNIQTQNKNVQINEAKNIALSTNNNSQLLVENQIKEKENQHEIVQNFVQPIAEPQKKDKIMETEQRKNDKVEDRKNEILLEKNMDQVVKETNEIVKQQNKSPDLPIKNNENIVQELLPVKENSNIPNENILPRNVIPQNIIPQNVLPQNIIPQNNLPQRDILANQENTENPNRIKREANELNKEDNNEKCEKTEKTPANHNLENGLRTFDLKEGSETHYLEKSLETHNLKKDLETHNLEEGLEIHNLAKGLEIHNPEKDLETHNPEKSLEIHNLQKHEEEKTGETHNLEKNIANKLDSPLKLITEMSKSDILKIESHNLIQSMQSHLRSESVHMKK